jgi:hypothetical protein
VRVTGINLKSGWQLSLCHVFGIAPPDFIAIL